MVVYCAIFLFPIANIIEQLLSSSIALTLPQNKRVIESEHHKRVNIDKNGNCSFEITQCYGSHPKLRLWLKT